MDPQEASLIAKIIHAARTVSLKTPLWRKRRESAFVSSPDFLCLFYCPSASGLERVLTKNLTSSTVGQHRTEKIELLHSWDMSQLFGLTPSWLGHVPTIRSYDLPGWDVSQHCSVLRPSRSGWSYT